MLLESGGRIKIERERERAVHMDMNAFPGNSLMKEKPSDKHSSEQLHFLQFSSRTWNADLLQSVVAHENQSSQEDISRIGHPYFPSLPAEKKQQHKKLNT